MKFKSFTNSNAKISILMLLVITVMLLLTARWFSVNTKQDIRNRASTTSRLYFSPSSTQTNPIQTNANNTFTVQLMIDPGQALVSFIRFEILYDQTKLAVSGQNSITINSQLFPVTFEDPLLTTGKVTGSVSIGNDPTKAVSSPSAIATITFTALANTTGPIQIKYGSQSQVLSLGPNEGATDNALGSIEPAMVLIGPQGSNTMTPTITKSPSITPTASVTPTASINPTGNQQPTPSDNLTGCRIPVPETQNVYGITQVGSQIWVAATGGVIRLNNNGTLIGPILTGNGLNTPTGIAVVDSEVWIINRTSKQISRFNQDGTAIAPILLNDNNIPSTVRLSSIAVIGQEVWITDEANGKIYRLDKTGQLTTTPISDTTQITILDSPQALTKIGNEVWALNSNFHNKINSIPDIVRYGVTGAYINNISNTGRTNDELPIDITTVGNNVWYLVNNVNARILRLNSDGTINDVFLTINGISAKRFMVGNNKIYILEHSG
jgi:hypothetical protein